MLKGFTRNFKPLDILTEEQVETIHKGILDILRETGVRFESDWALKFFKKHDCEVDFENNRVRFPEGLVEECLRKCPSSFRIKARDPKNDLTVGGNTVYFKSSAGMQTIDLDTYELRTPTKADYIDMVKVLDALPNVHCFSPYPYYGFHGVPPVMAIPEGNALKTRYSTKFNTSCSNFECEIFNIKIAEAVGSETMGSATVAPPMTWYDDQVSAVRRLIEAGFPITTWDGCVHGGTGPATCAGSVITSSVEHISMIVLIQLLDPGHRVRAGHFTFPQDMRTGSPAFGAIGCSISSTIFNQVWRKYRIPRGNANCYSSSKQFDYQQGYEKAFGAILSALSGTNMIELQSSVSSELSSHPVMAILDDDIAGIVGRFIEGEEISDETLAIDLIEEVGPIPGFYLDKEHTRKWWKREQFVPKAADRLTYPEWMKTGKKSCLDYAKERVEEILVTHKPTPLTPGQEEDIERILNEAREYYRKKGLISDEEWAVYKKVW